MTLELPILSNLAPPTTQSPKLARYPHAFDLAKTHHRDVIDSTIRRVLVAADILRIRKERGVTAFFKRRLREELVSPVGRAESVVT